MELDSNPLFSIVVPARNEERSLPHCVKSIKLAASKLGREVEIIVVLNRCTDRTEEVANDLGCVLARHEEKNLSAIRNEGVKMARGSVIVTIDADSVMSESLLEKIHNVMESGSYIGGGAPMMPERWSLGIFITYACLALIAMWFRISGGVFYLRREDFDELSGFDETLLSAEDIDFARRLKAHGRKKGKKFKMFLWAYIKTSCRKFDAFGDWYFVRHPLLTMKLLRGESKEDADRVWYDFER